jgi:hypothetical protein
MSKKKPSTKIDKLSLDKFNKKITREQQEELLITLQKRYEQKMSSFFDFQWTEIEKRIRANESKLQSLYYMEETGGEPNLVGQDEDTGEYIFYDCSKESPTGRRSICYDGDGQKEREKKGVFPAGNAIDMAKAMKIEILSEGEFQHLQKFGSFDTKTSSWIKTPLDIRELGGAIFVDFRYNRVFVYHNSAPSFYSARGFRGSLKV